MRPFVRPVRELRVTPNRSAIQMSLSRPGSLLPASYRWIVDGEMSSAFAAFLTERPFLILMDLNAAGNPIGVFFAMIQSYSILDTLSSPYVHL